MLVSKEVRALSIGDVMANDGYIVCSKTYRSAANEYHIIVRALDWSDTKDACLNANMVVQAFVGGEA